jgi:hypothetical protein
MSSPSLDLKHTRSSISPQIRRLLAMGYLLFTGKADPAPLLSVPPTWREVAPGQAVERSKEQAEEVVAASPRPVALHLADVCAARSSTAQEAAVAVGDPCPTAQWVQLAAVVVGCHVPRLSERSWFGWPWDIHMSRRRWPAWSHVARCSGWSPKVDVSLGCSGARQ